MHMLLEHLRHMKNAFLNSARGISATVKNEKAFRQEIALLVPHFLLLYFLNFSWKAWLLLSALLVLILFAELLNSAIECVVDLASPGYHELAKRAKDAASAAVGLLLLLYFSAWAILLCMGSAWRG